MLLSDRDHRVLQEFISSSGFIESGAIITDLDGTAVHEFEGKVVIPKEVELGLLRHYRDGRPVVVNSLRFPLSIMRTFAKDWYELSKAPIPIISLNGSLIGFIDGTDSGVFEFREIAAFPLQPDEIKATLRGVAELVTAGIENLLVFYYPRDWRIGEVIWTPHPEKVISVKEKYLSASAVTAVELPKLEAQMLAEDVCMIFLLIDAPQDQLMAYQHTKQSNFITHQGVDKLFGAETIAKSLGFDLSNSIGAGDTELDRFLLGVGLAVLVGNGDLPYRGVHNTLKLNTSFEFGALLFRTAELADQKLQ